MKSYRACVKALRILAAAKVTKLWTPTLSTRHANEARASSLRLLLLKRSHGHQVLLAAALLGVAHYAQAQWAQQQIPLKPGWNAVFLEVDPSPKDCDTLFAGLPVESVWDFNRPAESAQFVQDPTTLIPGAPGWLTWFPPTHPLVGKANLFILRDGRPYLIKLADGAQPTTWTVTGRPSLRGLSWKAGALNFVGFHVSPTLPPSFTTLFAGEAGLAGQPVYSLDATGAWKRLSDLSVSQPRPGEAYWIRCLSPATRSATILVNSGSREGLLFDRNGAERSILVRNTSTAARNISLRVIPSASPPAGEPGLAGPVPLEYWDANFTQVTFDWKPLTNTLSFFALAPGAEWSVRIGVRRASLPPATAGSLFQSLVEITDDLGARWLVPASTEPASVTLAAGPIQSSANGDSNPCAGLWIGEAVINTVSQPAHPGDATSPRPAGGDFSFRLIVHVDEDGKARLLQKVFIVRKPPTFIPDPANPGYTIIDQPSRAVLLADESLIPSIIGAGSITGRRVSSSAFGFSNPLVLTPNGAFGSGTLGVGITLDYNHPLNPFKHVYHPDHNNLDERFEQTLSEGRESFTVTRTVAMEFTATDPLGLNPPGWGDSEFGGNYRETISGLHRSAIRIAGTFHLARVARTATLDEVASPSGL